MFTCMPSFRPHQSLYFPPYQTKQAILCLLPMLSSCVAIGISGVESAAIATTAVIAGAAAQQTPTQAETEIYGTYKEGFWFDRQLFSVWVIANSPGEAELVARETAQQTCNNKNGTLLVKWVNAWQERRLFIPVTIERFSYEMRFRCPPKET